MHRTSAPVRLPPGRFAWANDQADRWIEWVKDSGIHVVGDLDDLRPLPAPRRRALRQPRQGAARVVLGAAVDALSAMTREAAARPDPRRTFGAPVPQVPRALVTLAHSARLARRGESAPGAGSPTCARAVRRPGRTGRASGTPAGATSPAPSSWSCCAGSTPRASPAPGSPRRVLTASAAGRGRPDLELVGAGPESAFGPAPVDPADLPAGELVRVAASVLADQVVDAGVPDRPSRRRPSWWRRGYRLVGDPEIADPLRAQLVARGRPPGGREPRIVVVGTDLATMAGTRLDPPRPHRGRDRVARLAARCCTNAARCRPAPTCSPSAAPGSSAGRQGPGARRARPGRRTPAGRRPAPLTTPAARAGRGGRAGPPGRVRTGLLVLPDVRETLLTTRLRPRIEAAAAGVPDAAPLVVPPAHRDWFETAAEKMRQGIQRAGYAVHGDLDALVPRWPAGPDAAGRTLARGHPRPGGPGAARRAVR